jgi:hypothetical protein
MSKSDDIQMQDRLDAITSRLQCGDSLDPLIAQAQEPQTELVEFVDTIQALHRSLTPMQPNRKYADRLHADLLDGRPGVVARVRQMPPRVHAAAILALCAGCVVFVLRRIFDSDPAQEIQEEAVATPL